MFDILIIGGGPAGLSAAVAARLCEKRVLVIEKKIIGGQILGSLDVRNWPGIDKISGKVFAKKLTAQAVSLGAEFERGSVSRIEKSEEGERIFTAFTEDGRSFKGKTVIIAVGVIPRPLDIEGAEKYVGNGLSYCGARDGMAFAGKRVAILGGGNTALTGAEAMAGICSRVYVVHRRLRFRGNQLLVLSLDEKENVKKYLPYIAVDIKGDKKVESLVIENVETGERKEILCEGIIVSFGHKPINEAFKNLIDLDENGFADSGENCFTSTEGVFVAGDCRKKKVRQLVTAAADGNTASAMAVEYLDRHENV